MVLFLLLLKVACFFSGGVLLFLLLRRRWPVQGMISQAVACYCPVAMGICCPIVCAADLVSPGTRGLGTFYVPQAVACYFLKRSLWLVEHCVRCYIPRHLVFFEAWPVECQGVVLHCRTRHVFLSFPAVLGGRGCAVVPWSLIATLMV